MTLEAFASILLGENASIFFKAYVFEVGDFYFLPAPNSGVAASLKPLHLFSYFARGTR